MGVLGSRSGDSGTPTATFVPEDRLYVLRPMPRSADGAAKCELDSEDRLGRKRLHGREDLREILVAARSAVQPMLSSDLHALAAEDRRTPLPKEL
jgi:hypothetical protein